jgi:hypothetical protein
MFNIIKSECSLSQYSKSPEWNMWERKLLDDWMARWNIELELSTIIVVDRYATLIMSSETMLCTWHNVTQVPDRRTCSAMIWKSLNKGYFWRVSSRVIWESLNKISSFKLPGRTKDIFLKERKLCYKCEFTRFGNLQNERLRQMKAWLDIEVALCTSDWIYINWKVRGYLKVASIMLWLWKFNTVL